ncbi:PASTA domain-containing protein [Nocardia sp. AB354]|uniref:PASTA domain-containing protein n=1 Tax=Nocardia sp. AB354 TaxID=3413283 RepID=UPI003C160910
MPTTTFPRRSNHNRRTVLSLRISIAALALTAVLSGCDSETATPATSTTGASTAAATATSGTPNAANPAQPTGTTTSPAAGTVSVPDVRGDRPALADQLLTAAGLRAHITGGTSRGPGGGQCVITTQNPDAGVSVPTGATIELTTGEVGGGQC